MPIQSPKPQNPTPQLTFGPAEGLTVASAFLFAIHILATDRITKAHDPPSVTLAMFLCTAAFAALALPVAMARPGSPSIAELTALLLDAGFATPLLLATFLATVLALTLMNSSSASSIPCALPSSSRSSRSGRP